MIAQSRGLFSPSCLVLLVSPILCPTSILARDVLDTVAPLEQRLAEEIRKMIDAGHLRPAYCITPEGYLNHSQAGRGKTCDFDDYWANPAETIYALVRALPHMPQGPYPGDRSRTWAAKLKGYLRTEFNTFKPYQWTHAGDDGARREVNNVPREYRADFGKNYHIRKSPGATRWRGWSFNPFNFYACWKYAQVFQPEEPGLAKGILGRMRGKIAAIPADEAWLKERPHVLNCYIAGYYGYLGLQDLAGEKRDAAVEARLEGALQKRLAHLAINPAMLRGLEAGGFLYLVPELGQYLYEHGRPAVQRNVRIHSDLAAYWFAARAPEDTRADNADKHIEGGLTHYYEYWSLFNGKACALKEDRAELEKHLDVPAVRRGDLYYVLNLVATIEAPGTSP